MTFIINRYHREKFKRARWQNLTSLEKKSSFLQILAATDQPREVGRANRHPIHHEKAEEEGGTGAVDRQRNKPKS